MLSEENNFAYSRVGTPYYMSPEQIEDMRYNEKSDIWSLGCFLYELATFSPPFNATNQLSLALKIKSGNVANIPSIYSQELSSVIMCLMRVNPENRPNAEEITNYPPVIIRIRERKLKEYYLKLKKKEQDLQKREEIVNMKEEEIKKKEKEFIERESEINTKEDNLENKELELHKREMMVEIREKELLEKEESLKQKNNLNNNSTSSKNHNINQNMQFQNAPIGQVNFDFNKLNINKTGNNY
jgi:NIMA (never in mitosis gene a)-related kinase